MKLVEQNFSQMIFLSILLVLLCYLIWCINDRLNYFKKQNVKYLKSDPLLGALKDSMLKKISLFENIANNYNTPELKDEPYFGMFVFLRPIITVKDPELIKRILITDFNSFNSRKSESGVHDPIGYYHPFLSSHSLWKNIRPKVSQFFTSSKLKSAFYLLEKLSDDLCGYIEQRLVNNRVELPIKFITDLFSIDAVSSVALGVEAHSLKNSGSEFLKVAESMWEASLKRNFELGSILVFPGLGKLFRSTIMGKYADNFLYSVAPQIIEERERNGQKRNDLIDILIEMKKDLKPEANHTVDHILISQIATFLHAGYETTSATMSFTLYELSKNQKIQKKLRNEIKEVLAKNDGKICYEFIAFPNEMPYLHKVVNESMRLYNSVPVLDRKCTNPEGYSMEPFGKYHVPYGMSIQIPTFAIARDEKYFPEPLKFNPERFSGENVEKTPNCSHMPFGEGPHNCVGERFALIKVKIAVCNVLKSYRVEMTERTPKEIKFDKNALAVRSADELFVDFVKDSLF